jgi:hypothetical protein
MGRKWKAGMTDKTLGVLSYDNHIDLRLLIRIGRHLLEECISASALVQGDVENNIKGHVPP